MPEPAAFLAAWDLRQGRTFQRHHTLLRLRIQHVVVERYRRYAFPLDIDIRSTRPAAEVLRAFSHLVSRPRVVLSRYGNPYLCHLLPRSIRRLRTQTTAQGTPLYIYRLTSYGQARRILPSQV